MAITDAVQPDPMRERSLNDRNVLIYLGLIAICTRFCFDYGLASKSLLDWD